MKEHYTENELEIYRHGKMSLLGRILCSAHLKKCPECRKKMEQLDQDDRFVDQLRQSMRVYGDVTCAVIHPAKSTQTTDF